VADPTKKFDELIDRAEKSFDRIMGKISGPARPPGSTATSRGDMLAEFREIELDPDGLTLKREELDRAHGPVEGARQFAQWYRDMMNG
jgi:hypothetical protein